MSLAVRIDRRAGVRGAHVARWLAAGAFTVLAHATALWTVLNWRSAEVLAPSEPPPAVTIDLSPLISPDAPQQDVAVGPQMTEAQPAPSDKAAKKTAQAAPDPSPQAQDEPFAEPVPPPLASASPEPEVPPAASETEATAYPNPPPPSPTNPTPPSPPQPSAPTGEELSLPPAPSPEAETAPPAPPVQLQAPQPPSSASPSPEPANKAHEAPPARVIPKTERLPAALAKAAQAGKAKPSVTPPRKTQPPLRDKQRTRAESKRVERTKATKPDDRREADRTRAPAGSNAPAVKPAASPSSSSGATASSALATWKGELVAHINRFKRFPPNAASGGTVSVVFAINRGGSVVSARLIASSGDRALDEEAVALLHRASPVPPPPAQFGGNVITLTVPIRFDR